MPKGVRPDAHDDGVAGADDAGGVGEDVRAPLEHEADDAERGAPRLDAPSVVGERRYRRVAAQRRPLPRPQAGDHVVAHPAVSVSRVVERPAAPAAATSAALAAAIGATAVVVAETVGEGGEEGGDLLVGNAGQLRERGVRRPTRPRRRLVLGRWDVQHVAGVGQHDEAVAGGERSCQLVGHGDGTVAADDDQLPRLEPLERQRSAHRASVGCTL